jgi:hypothetical protein
LLLLLLGLNCHPCWGCSWVVLAVVVQLHVASSLRQLLLLLPGLMSSGCLD